MKQILTAILFVLLAASLAADEVLSEFTWPTLPLAMTNSESSPKTIQILDLQEPGITTPAYALTGRIRYENVEGTGYLEMWSHFPEDKAFFSRTLGQSGPMKSISGSSDWRTFQLPFYAKDESGWLDIRPERLVFNLVLPGKGTVYLESVKLVQYNADGKAGATGAVAWRSKRMVAILVGVAGIVCGVAGVLVFLVIRKRRTAAELRRIKAMDA